MNWCVICLIPYSTFAISPLEWTAIRFSTGSIWRSARKKSTPSSTRTAPTRHAGLLVDDPHGSMQFLRQATIKIGEGARSCRKKGLEALMARGLSPEQAVEMIVSGILQ